MSAKFDEDVNNSLVAIVFTRIRCDARTDWLTDARTDGTTAALLYPLRNALRGDKKIKSCVSKRRAHRARADKLHGHSWVY